MLRIDYIFAERAERYFNELRFTTLIFIYLRFHARWFIIIAMLHALWFNTYSLSFICMSPINKVRFISIFLYISAYDFSPRYYDDLALYKMTIRRELSSCLDLLSFRLHASHSALQHSKWRSLFSLHRDVRYKLITVLHAWFIGGHSRSSPLPYTTIFSQAKSIIQNIILLRASSSPYALSLTFLSAHNAIAAQFRQTTYMYIMTWRFIIFDLSVAWFQSAFFDVFFAGLREYALDATPYIPHRLIHHRCSDRRSDSRQYLIISLYIYWHISCSRLHFAI